jgi:hypothetical protein
MSDAQQRIEELEAENQKLIALAEEQAKLIQEMKALVEGFAALAGCQTAPEVKGLAWLAMQPQLPQPKRRGRPKTIPEAMSFKVGMTIGSYLREGKSLTKSVYATVDCLWDLCDDPQERLSMRRLMTGEFNKKVFNEISTKRKVKIRWLRSIQRMYSKIHSSA